jgi:hypothetical protein
VSLATALYHLSLTHNSVEKYPEGYPQQAAFQASEPSWSIYRGFSYLHSRVILDLQDELRCLEENLEEIDSENEENDRVRSRKNDLKHALQEGIESPRARLIERLHDKLMKYGESATMSFSQWVRVPEPSDSFSKRIDEILVKARTLNTFQRPSNHDYRGFRTWFWNMKPLSHEIEEQFIKRKEDLISLRQGREWSGFDALVETCIRKFHGPVTQVSIVLRGCS